MPAISVTCYVSCGLHERKGKARAAIHAGGRPRLSRHLRLSRPSNSLEQVTQLRGHVTARHRQKQNMSHLG